MRVRWPLRPTPCFIGVNRDGICIEFLLRILDHEISWQRSGGAYESQCGCWEVCREGGFGPHVG